MATSLDETGVMRVNGAWATRITYAAVVLGPTADTVDVRFLQGRTEVSRVSLAREQLRSVLGEKNESAIERHIASDANKYLAVVTGELRGRQLHYREVSLPASAATLENSIGEAPLRARMPLRHDEDAILTTDRDGLAPKTSPIEVGSGESDSEQRRREKASRGSPAHAAVPAHIASKYLVNGNSYHFDDQTVAFVDAGSKLTAQTHNKAIIQDLIAIAHAREWQAISVSGTESFRREVWREAVLSGLVVDGYRPTAVERAAVERDRARRNPANAPPSASSPETKHAESQSVSARATSRDAPFAPTDAGVRYGTLVAHGEAPYRHDATKSASYFVTLKDAQGQERTSWGVGLAAAVRNSETAVQVNDAVGIRRGAATPVTVQARSVSEEGEIVVLAVDAKRNAWQIEKAAYFDLARGKRQEAASPAPVKDTTVQTADVASPPAPSESRLRDQESAAAIRSARTTREELQLKYPELSRAVFQHLASHEQFAEAFVQKGLIRESDRAQVITQLHERLASKLERGTRIREPDNKQVDTLIRRSVNRVAADIGRPPVEEVTPHVPEPTAHPPMAREDIQVSR